MNRLRNEEARHFLLKNWSTRQGFRQVLHLDGCLVTTFPAFFPYFALVMVPSRESLQCKMLLKHLRQLIYSEIY